MNFTKHEMIANNTRDLIIREIILKKCSFYYEFEALMREFLIVTLFYIKESLKSDTFEFNSLIAKRETREKIENTKNTHNDIVDENYDKWTQDDDNEMKKNVFDSNSMTKLLNQTSKSKANLIKVAKQRYANNIKKFDTSRKRLMKIDSDSEDVQSKREFKREFKWEKIKSMTDDMIEMRMMKSRDFFKQFKFEQI
jgi:hypothetical protein